MHGVDDPERAQSRIRVGRTPRRARPSFPGITSLIGIFLGLSFFPFAYLVWGDARVAGTVALALLGSTATATFVAMALPYGLNRLGRDPAFGAGPLATVVQDLLSILIYFAIATVLAV